MRKSTKKKSQHITARKSPQWFGIDIYIIGLGVSSLASIMLFLLIGEQFASPKQSEVLSANITASSETCIPRPTCLDTTPHCMIAEPPNGWCPTTANVTPIPLLTGAPAGCFLKTICSATSNNCKQFLECSGKEYVVPLASIPVNQASSSTSSAQKDTLLSQWSNLFKKIFEL